MSEQVARDTKAVVDAVSVGNIDRLSLTLRRLVDSAPAEFLRLTANLINTTQHTHMPNLGFVVFAKSEFYHADGSVMAGLLAGRWYRVRVTAYYSVRDVFQARFNSVAVLVDGADCSIGTGIPRPRQCRSHPSDGLSRATLYRKLPMATTNSFHHLNDGRGKRAVYVNGNPISRVVWCDTARGLAVFCPFPVRINRRTGKVYNRLLLYCFDLMRNDIPGGPYLKTFNEAGEITFNSLQAPLNVIASMGAPAPTGTDRYGRRYGYAGGRWELVRRQTANVDSQAHHLIDIPLSAGVEYAACLPWSRAANAFLGNALTGVDGIVYGMSEGAFGRSGGISFMFAPAGVTTQAGTPSNQYSLPGSFEGFPVDRSPTALVINTANYPFPYR